MQLNGTTAEVKTPGAPDSQTCILVPPDNVPFSAVLLCQPELKAKRLREEKYFL